MTNNITATWTCGACPVQIEGEINGYPYYFRARGRGGSIQIALTGGELPTLNPAPPDHWFYEEEYGDGFSAGWMPDDVAMRFIEQAAAKFAAEHGSEGDE